MSTARPLDFTDYPMIASADVRDGDQIATLFPGGKWVVRVVDATSFLWSEYEHRLLHRPDPPEPTKVGAVVVDSDGDVWARDAEGMWHCLDGGTAYRHWHALVKTWSPLRVAFEGVDE